MFRGPSSDFGQCERGKRCAMSKFFELIKFLGQHWPGFCSEKNESHFPNFLKDANPLKSDEGPYIFSFFYFFFWDVCEVECCEGSVVVCREKKPKRDILRSV